jgi:predicted  nucleic acid-binding Zn-ribbon protein
MKRKLWPLFTGFAGAVLLAGASPTHAQTVISAQQEIAAALIDAEGNLTTAEGIGMNIKDWQSRLDSYNAQLKDLNDRVAQGNAFCEGTFEKTEYERRKTQCDALGSQLGALKDQLEPERVNLQAEQTKLQQREADNKQAMEAIQARLIAGIDHLTAACAKLSTEEFASCKIPPAPGPRTASLVAQLNADLAGAK